MGTRLKRALVIDDNGIFRESVVDLIEELDFQTTEATGAKQALSHDGPFDVILCDLIMPTSKIDQKFVPDLQGEAPDRLVPDSLVAEGIQTIQALAKKFPATPIIAMSGVVEDSIIKALPSYGVAASLQKPFSFEQLSTALKQVASPLDPVQSGR